MAQSSYSTGGGDYCQLRVHQVHKVVSQTHPTIQTDHSDITIRQLYTTVVNWTFSFDPCFVTDICNKTWIRAERRSYDCRIERELANCDIRIACLGRGVRLIHDICTW